jgi:ornithine cyclodeaminase
MAGKRELDAAVLERAGVVAADDVRQCRAVGELQYAAERAAVALGDVIAGRVPGRTSPDQITVADLTGLGAEDAAIGTALARAL